MKCVHQNGLAMRSIEVSRVLVTGKNRVRLGGAGIMDCLNWDGGQNVAAYQVSLLLPLPLSLSPNALRLIKVPCV